MANPNLKGGKIRQVKFRSGEELEGTLIELSISRYEKNENIDWTVVTSRMAWIRFELTESTDRWRHFGANKEAAKAEYRRLYRFFRKHLGAPVSRERDYQGMIARIQARGTIAV